VTCALFITFEAKNSSLSSSFFIFPRVSGTLKSFFARWPIAHSLTLFTMMILRALPIYLTLLLLDIVAAKGIVSRTLHSVQNHAQRHTKRLASDLRVAFGALLVSQDAVSNATPQRVVYCKSAGGGSSLSNGNGSNGTSPATLVDSYSGVNFFDAWSFWTTGDPTNGIVDYVDEATARSNNLLEVNSDGNAVMRVETTPSVPANRMSIRITSQKSYNGGLFILDAVHMPTGCGTWPAWWTNGPNWPAGGEIDIVEGVSNYTNNQATIHTNPGCSLASSDPSVLNITGTIVGGTNCAAAESNNEGCGVRSPDSHSFGAAFNSIGGGVYAMSWSSDGIAVYFFERSSIPDDITNSQPLPSGWGTPMARWPATNCNTSTFFYDHSVIFDTTLCGDWAGGVWGSSGIPGQEQSCAQRTGVSTCEAFVRANGASFTEAYWEVKSVQVYQEQ